MSELSPLDILGKSFPRALRGLSPAEVHQFLSEIAATVESLVRERAELRQQVHKLEQRLMDYRERESALQDALVAAQRSAESTMERARDDAQRIVQEGHALADRLVEEAYQRAQTIETVIGELRGRRREVRAELMRLGELLQGIIRDDQRLEQEAPSTPQLALLHRRRSEEQA